MPIDFDLIAGLVGWFPFALMFMTDVFLYFIYVKKSCWELQK